MDDPKRCLIGKILVDHKTLGKAGVISIIKNAWRTKEPVTVHSWEQNHFLFIFGNESDINKIVAESPWSIMGYYLALSPWNPTCALSEINFNRGTFWVQAHGLPLGKLTKTFALELASKIGLPVDVDCMGEGLQLNRSFLRFRVGIDLSEPLSPGFELVREGQDPLFITFKYERLANFCYSCGRLGHEEDSCSFQKNPLLSRVLIENMRASSVKRLVQTTQGPKIANTPNAPKPTNSSDTSTQHGTTMMTLETPCTPKETLKTTFTVNYTFNIEVIPDFVKEPRLNNSVLGMSKSDLSPRKPYFVTSPTESPSESPLKKNEGTNTLCIVPVDTGIEQALNRLSVKRIGSPLNGSPVSKRMKPSPSSTFGDVPERGRIIHPKVRGKKGGVGCNMKQRRRRNIAKPLSFEQPYQLVDEPDCNMDDMNLVDIPVSTYVENTPTSNVAKQDIPRKWFHPTRDSVKINCDASFSQQKASTGVIARDHAGNILWCLGSSMAAASPLAAELLAIREAVSMSSKRHGCPVIIESDSQLAIRLSCGELVPPWSLSPIVEDIQQLASQQSLEFVWINRNCNRVAHELARLSSVSIVRFFWDVNFPVQITSIVRSDL